jgi:hypothetical protein
MTGEDGSGKGLGDRTIRTQMKSWRWELLVCLILPRQCVESRRSEALDIDFQRRNFLQILSLPSCERGQRLTMGWGMTERPGGFFKIMKCHPYPSSSHTG